MVRLASWFFSAAIAAFAVAWSQAEAQAGPETPAPLEPAPLEMPALRSTPAFPPLRWAGHPGPGGRSAGGSELLGLPGFVDERGNTVPGPSRGRTILLSALVPGLGQLLNGNRASGTAFLLGDVASWTSLIVFRVQGNLRQDRYVEFAERFAGVEDASGQSNAYYGFLTRYDRSGEPGGPDSYNEIEVRLRAIRELYPDDPASQERYIQEHSIDGAQAWDWESDERRREYAGIRSGSETAYHRSDFALGGLVAGRILSLMHAVWLTGKADGESETGEGAPTGSRGGTTRPFLDANPLSGASRLGVRYRF